MKIFGNNSTKRHTISNTPRERRSQSKKNERSSAANYCSMGDRSYQEEDFKGAVDYYLKSLHLVLPKETCHELELDRIQCKKNCIAGSTLMKVSMAYLKVGDKGEARSSLKSAKTLIERVTLFEIDQENVRDGEDYVLRYSAASLLSKVLETEGDLVYESHDMTMAEEDYHKALYHKRKALNIRQTQKSVAKIFTEQVEIDLDLALLLQKIARVLQKRGNYRECELAYSEALAIRQGAKQSDTDKDIISLQLSLLQVHKESGDYVAAMKCLDVLMEACKKEEITKKTKLFKLTLEKSEIYIQAEKYDLAMSAATDSLELTNFQGANYNERLLSRAVSTEQIAKVLQAQCSLEEAILWHKRAHTIRSSILPETHELILHSTKQIAWIYLKQKKVEKAKTLFKEIRDKLIIAYGIEHESVADLLDDIGDVYSQQKNFSIAIKCHKKALDIRRKCAPSLHKDGAKTLDKIACILLKKGRKIDAMNYFSEALDVLRKSHCCKKDPMVVSTVRHMTSFDHREDEIESTSVFM